MVKASVTSTRAVEPVRKRPASSEAADPSNSVPPPSRKKPDRAKLVAVMGKMLASSVSRRPEETTRGGKEDSGASVEEPAQQGSRRDDSLEGHVASVVEHAVHAEDTMVDTGARSSTEAQPARGSQDRDSVREARLQRLYEEAMKTLTAQRDRGVEVELMGAIKELGRFPMREAADDGERKLANRLDNLRRRGKPLLMKSQTYLEELREYTLASRIPQVRRRNAASAAEPAPQQGSGGGQLSEGHGTSVAEPGQQRSRRRKTSEGGGASAAESALDAKDRPGRRHHTGADLGVVEPEAMAITTGHRASVAQSGPQGSRRRKTSEGGRASAAESALDAENRPGRQQNTRADLGVVEPEAMATATGRLGAHRASDAESGQQPSRRRKTSEGGGASAAESALDTEDRPGRQHHTRADLGVVEPEAMATATGRLGAQSFADTRKRQRNREGENVTLSQLQKSYRVAWDRLKGQMERSPEADLLCEIKEFGRFPNRTATAEGERKLAKKLDNLKRRGQSLLLSTEKYLDELRRYTRDEETVLELMRDIRAFHDRTGRLPEEVRGGAEESPEQIQERQLAQRMNKAIKKQSLEDVHLDEIKSYRTWFCQELEDMWKALNGHYWYIGDDYKKMANTETIHVLMRQFDTARSDPGKSALKKLAGHLHVVTEWKNSMETPATHIYHSKEDTLRRCRKRLYHQAAVLLKSVESSGSQAASVVEPDRPLRFLTPRTRQELAASMLDEGPQRERTPFGCDFAEMTFHGVLHVEDLVDALAVLEGVATEVSQLPLDNARILDSILESSATAPKVGSDGELVDEDLLTTRLAEACVGALTVGGNWIARAVRRKGSRVQHVEASDMVKAFLAFLDEFEVLPTLVHFSAKRLLTLCIWHYYLLAPDRKRKTNLTHRSPFLYSIPTYVPAEAVQQPGVPYFKDDDPETPYFVDAVERARRRDGGVALLTAPRVCQLCGRGFLHRKALLEHCDKEHGNWNEYRKRVFWEAENLMALPLDPETKRNRLSNFTHRLVYSTPASGGDPEPRREEPCAVCARKGWLEQRYRTFMWKELRSDGPAADAEGHPEADDEADLADVDPKGERRRALFMDSDGTYYFGDPAEVNKHLSVTKYAEALPLIPLEELHASSIQHPRFPGFRWLLHTRRVKIVEGSEISTRGDGWRDVGEPPPCAGVGDEEATAWLCRECRDALCHKNAIGMPGPALANVMWGGREHPDYQNLSSAMRMLLGLGRPLYRKMILGKGDPKFLSSALYGNTILLAQPTTGEIQAQLPAPPEHISDNIAVVFTIDRQDVRKAKELHVSREQYLRCARLRKEICYAFADVRVDEKGAIESLPENGVPEVFVAEACHMSEVQYFKPNMDGPAARRDPAAAEPDVVDAEVEEMPESDDEAEGVEKQTSEGAYNENLLGLDEAHGNDPLRQLIQLQRRMRLLQEEGDKLVRMQSQFDAQSQRSDIMNVAIQAGTEQCRQYFLDVKDIAKKMTRDERDLDLDTTAFMRQITRWDPEDERRQPYNFTYLSECIVRKRRSMDETRRERAEAGSSAAESIPIPTDAHPETSVDSSGLQTSVPSEPIHNAIDGDFDASVVEPVHAHPENSVDSSGLQTSVPSEPIHNAIDGDFDASVVEPVLKGLNVKAGKALSMLSHIAWVVSFVEFLYGDCAPFQERPAKLSCEQVFSYLIQREELQYDLTSDTEPYRARPMSRWDTPEFVMVFASALRSLNILRASKFAVFGNGKTQQDRIRAADKFRQDLVEIVKAKAEDFERALAYERHKGARSLLGVFLSPQTRDENKRVHTALKHVLMQTATVPLTEGNKMKLRHQSFSLSMHHGSLKLFLTTNFADTYSPITLMLYQTSTGADDPIGSERINLFDDAPTMPTLQTMHRIVAAYPTIQAKLFLLMERLTISELLCIDEAYIGRVSLGSDPGLDASPSRYTLEDDYASNGEPGLANFAVSMLEPEESQGRGFTHGHKKVIGVPRCRAAVLQRLFRGDEKKDADELRTFMREMRDAVLEAASTIQYDSATLCAKQLGQEVMSEPFSTKQRLQSRLDGGLEMDDLTRRENVEVTQSEPPGHLRRERDLAEAEMRSQRHPFRDVPLTGCHQSMMPSYRLASSFGQIRSLDDFGLVGAGEQLQNPPASEPWIATEGGEVIGFLSPSGIEASPEERIEDARQWEQAYARDVRALHVQNHTHDCTDTCIKYAAKKEEAAESLAAGKVPPCRFLFFQILTFLVTNSFGKELLKRVLRRGKALVTSAYIAGTNERNEYGKAIVERQHPFRGSTSDLAQAALRCNSDVQYQDRALPETEAAEHVSGSVADNEDDGTAGQLPVAQGDETEGGQTAIEATKATLLFGVRRPYPLQRTFIFALCVAMKAAAICDFYMTKYQAKAQQMMTSAIGPLLQGMRRCEAEEQSMTQDDRTIEQRALSKLRRLMFAANKSHWFSACELAIYLITQGGHALATHQDQVIFLAKPHFMMQECKRLLNGGTLEHGPLEPSQEVTLDMFVVQESGRKDGGHDDDNADRVELRGEDVDPTATKRLHRSHHSHLGGVAEPGGAEDEEVVKEDAAELLPEDDGEEEDADDEVESRSDVEERRPRKRFRWLRAEDEDPAATNRLHRSHPSRLRVAAESEGAEDEEAVSEDAAESLEGDGRDEPGHGDADIEGDAKDGRDGEECEKTADLHIFQSTATNRDDWLHRGQHLYDLDYYHYVTSVQRARIPTDLSKRKDGGLFFAFDEHYIVSSQYCQQLRPNPRVVPRLVGASCVRSEVEGGEPHAMFKATLFSLMRCPGPGHCADVLQCRTALDIPAKRVLAHRPFCGDLLCRCRDHAPYIQRRAVKQGQFTFKKAWQVRRAQIEVLASDAQKKLDAAKRIPVIRDCDIFKAWEPTANGVCGSRRSDVANRYVVYQILRSAVLNYAQGGGHVRLQRVENTLAGFMGVTRVNHAHQLCLAEYVAFKGREVLLHMDLDIEARNTAVTKAKEHTRAVLLEDAEEVKEKATVVEFEFEDVGGHVVEDLDELPEVVESQGAVMSNRLDAGEIQRLLMRCEELQALKKPGRHAAEHMHMQTVAEVFTKTLEEVLDSFDVSARESVKFSHRVEHVLDWQRRRAEMIRRDLVGCEDSYNEEEEVASFGRSEPSATLFDLDLIRQGPGAVAWKLAHDAGLNADQLMAVALVAWPMQQEWNRLLRVEEPTADEGKEKARRKRRGAEESGEHRGLREPTGLASNVENQQPLLPLVGALVRILLVGGGGCGKSRIINRVYSPLLKCFYGARGLLKEAGSNKAARLIGGMTMHMANSLQGSSSLITVNLRLSPKKQKLAERRYGSLGSKLFDEFSQNNSKLFHADAYITALARAPIYGLDASRYSEADQTWGSMPVVGLAGDELQLPPVPMEASLLAPVEGSSHEQKVAVKIFSGFRYVYRLTTAMRFKDDLLKGLLKKMRTKGGCRLTRDEWKALLDTEVKGNEKDLVGTELWYEAAYVWSVVAMAQVIRSRLSAKHHKTTLFVAQAEDQLLNPFCLQACGCNVSTEEVRREAEKALLRHPNMNETGRLPSLWMGHVGMTVRLCQPVESGIAVTDSVGDIVGIDFDPREDSGHTEAVEHGDQSVVVLRHLPKCVYVKLHREEEVDAAVMELLPPMACEVHAEGGAVATCPDCKFFKDIVAVTPFQNKMAWSLDVRLKGFEEPVKLKVKRRQIPCVCRAASTLHVLQGTTCDPGLIFHWQFPTRLRKDLLWLAVYVVLSRVRRLANLKSIGISTKIRDVIEAGPPESLPGQFERYFAEKEKETIVAAKDAVSQLGWTLPPE